MERNLLFSNKTIMDNQTCKDFMQITWNKNGGIIRILLFIIGIISFGLGVFYLIAPGEIKLFRGIGMIVISAYPLFLAWKGYIFRLSKYIESQKKIWGSDTLEKQIDFYDTGFTQTTKLGVLEFENSKITAIVSNKTSIIIYMDNNALLISADGFIKGNKTEFIEYINGLINKN